ncbi:MAG: hypothetical protein B6I24_06460 [Bacteroidetes bacterium 4572_128]|nr:MAG: hypothetical protein B6I24_06460 [Bacteroidetes bacterium 4572_128]
MKKFIIKISIFILYLLTINFLVFQFITKDFVFHDYLKHEKPILKKKPNVLILGDSHPMVFIKVKILKFMILGKNISEEMNYLEIKTILMKQKERNYFL